MMLLDNLCFVDFETTGLRPDKDRIVEIGAVRGMYGEGGKLNLLVRLPLCWEMPAEASKINGLTTAQLNRHGMHPIPAMSCLENFAGYATVVAHNAGFDVAMWSEHTKRLNLPPLLNNFLCTKTLAVALLPGLPSYSLPKLCQTLGLEAAGRAHRAGADVERMMLLFQHMRGKFDSDQQFEDFALPYLNHCGRGAAHYEPMGFLPAHACEFDQFLDGKQQLDPGPTR